MTVLGAAGLAMGIGSSIASAVNSKKAADEQRKKQGLIEQQAAENEAWFNKQYYQDITKRSDIQNMLRILDQNQRKADTAVAARAAVTGATPEQKLASQEVNRRTYADALADIASNASQMRDQYVRNYQSQRNNTWAARLGMQDKLAAIHQNTAAQWANAANNGFSSGGQLFAYGLGGLSSGSGAAKAPSVNPNAAATHIDYVKPTPAANQPGSVMYDPFSTTYDPTIGTV